MSWYRVAVGGLAAALLVPALVAAPAATAAEPIDPVARAALLQSFTDSGAAWTAQGGTSIIRVRGPVGSSLTTFRVERGSNGVLRVLHELGWTGRTELYVTPANRSVERTKAPVRKALRKHGMATPPAWHRPVRQAGLTFPYDFWNDLANPGGFGAGLDEQLVELSADTSGSTVTYSLVIADGTSAAAVTRVTVVTAGGLLRSLHADEVSADVTYGHAALALPAVTGSPLQRRVLRREVTLHSLVTAMQLSIPDTGPVAKRVKRLRRVIESDNKTPYRWLRAEKSPRGVTVSAAVPGWKHPLTWRLTVTRSSVHAVPVRTAKPAKH